VVLSLAAEVGEGMLRLPEAEAKKRAAVISENKIAKQERKRHHWRTDGIDRRCAHLNAGEKTPQQKN
jgi:predicted transcriptional regulator